MPIVLLGVIPVVTQLPPEILTEDQTLLEAV